LKRTRTSQTKKKNMSDPVLAGPYVHIAHARCGLDSRAEVLAAWLIVLGRVTVSMGGRFAILGAGDILK
jgi:hypothetical protein